MTAQIRPGHPSCLAILSTVLVLGAAPTLGQTGPATVGDPEGALDRTAVAVPIAEAPTIDGVLDEPFWATIPPVTDFRQRDPVDGAEPTERTEVRIGYTADALYFGMTMYDSEPERILGNILQRGGWIDKDDRVLIALDTYRDGRNAYLFEIGSLGAQDDALISDESTQDWNWDGIYTTEARITDEGWVLEVEIPFTTIRFGDPTAPEMGIALYRSIRRKNEHVFWPHIGQEYRAGIMQVSRYGLLTGLRDLRQGRHVEVKPYAISGASKVSPDPVDTRVEVGLDVKAALTSSLTLDLTYNTDFAQVEADNVQINLTRFDLFFPEKREFFLERAALFQFGAPQETEVFFSRRVGLGEEIVGGGRLTGEAGPLSIGVLSLATERPAPGDPLRDVHEWSSVARVQARVRPRTTLGGIVTSRDGLDEHNRVVGADLFSRFWGSSGIFAWAADVSDSRFDVGTGSTSAGQVELLLQNDRFMLDLTRTVIGEDFSPALGFVPRPDQKRWGGQVVYRPRFEGSTWARQLTTSLGANHITGMNGDKQSHFRRIQSRLDFQWGDRVQLDVTERFERLEAPTPINGRPLPAGDYTFRTVSARFDPDRARALGPSFSVAHGGFWSGTRTQLTAGVVWIANKHLTLDADFSRNDVSLPVPDGDFGTNLVSLRTEAAFSRKLFAYALLQWDDVSDNFQANIRVDWIHTPGSDLFVVFDTGYFTGPLSDPRDPRWVRRTGVVKLTYLKAF